MLHDISILCAAASTHIPRSEYLRNVSRTNSTFSLWIIAHRDGVAGVRFTEEFNSRRRVTLITPTLGIKRINVWRLVRFEFSDWREGRPKFSSWIQLNSVLPRNSRNLELHCTRHLFPRGEIPLCSRSKAGSLHDVVVRTLFRRHGGVGSRRIENVVAFHREIICRRRARHRFRALREGIKVGRGDDDRGCALLCSC